MLEAQLFTSAAKPKGRCALPAEFDGVVNEAVLYDAVRAYRGNQRQGTHSTKTRGEVSGGSRKPWRQKGTGRARQGTTRASHWRGGGVVFGPKPRSYRIELPKKVKRLARQSALNVRANEGAVLVIEALEFAGPKTRQMVDLIGELGLAGRKVLVLTAETRQEIYLSGRNLPNVEVMRYLDAPAYALLWADTLVVERTALGVGPTEGSTDSPKRAKKVTKSKSPRKRNANSDA